jgi:signal transduction histidine kinase/ligand-binding sensor domain-containing protein
VERGAVLRVAGVKSFSELGKPQHFADMLGHVAQLQVATDPSSCVCRAPGESDGHIIGTREATFIASASEGLDSTMSRARSKSLRVAGSLLAVPLFFGQALGVPTSAQDQTISQMVHTSWTGKDGAPQAITGLAQTPDGTLWISTIAGLYSFDGVSFSLFKPLPNERSFPSIAIYSLYVSKTGDLWVMLRDGGAARIRQGHVAVFDRVDLKSDYITLSHLQQDSNGMMWAILNGQQLISLGQDQIWHPTTGPLHSARITSLFLDSAGTQWVVANGLLYKRPLGQVSFSPTEIHAEGGTKVAEAPDHTLWVVGGIPGTGKPGHRIELQHVDRSAKPLPCSHLRGRLLDVLPALDGSVWLSVAGKGLLRLPPANRAAHDPRNPAEAPDLYTIRDGLTSVQEWTLSTDADGNVWAGGASGLDRFEYASLIPAIGGAHSGYWYCCANQQGDVWGAEEQGPLFSFAHGHVSRIPGGKDIGGLFCGLDKKVWMIDRWGLSVVHSGRIQRLPVIPGQPRYRDYYHFVSLAEVAKNELVAVTWGALRDGLWIYRRGKWQPFLPGHAGNRINVVKAVRARLYLGYREGDIGVFQHDTGQEVWAASPGVGEIVALSQTSDGVFALGYDGIAAERGNTFKRLSFLHRDSAARICGLVESGNGDFWLNGAQGIVRIPHSEMVAAMTNPSHLISSDQMQEGDFVGPAFCPAGIESASIDANGKLWFATLNGVVSIDPDHLATPRHPPLLSVRSIVADGHEIDASATFPPDTHTLEIKYFGLDLTDPKRVVYRYRLEGLGSDSRDSSWQDVGARTEATYTHLRPSSYRFLVMASNGNDVWTQPVSSATFRILPHFYERPWVQGLFVLVGVLLLWAAISKRVHHVSAAIRMRAEERADERVRIARELHDTLLQGVQGLLLSFHVAAEKVPADHESKQALERALTTADRIIVEGRNRVTRLRSENLTDAELKSLIEGVAANLSGVAAAEFTLERRGGGGDTLQSHVVDEVFCIAREAVTNAYRHSGASRIVVELDYQKREFRMTCRDNGCGFDSKEFLTDQTNGHWGLRGMAERAERIGASFSCDGSVTGGTEVHLIVPARRAYQRQGRCKFLGKRTTA